ncbi:MAG: hypothetical protein LBM12_01710 [Candidatus Nomurabacteria bacterium]|jgi:hypothetical protein|nr:hypothetical protein [Candidatus Nomurabacteria bacterium]
MDNIAWEANEYNATKRGATFYIALTLATLSLGALAVFTRSWTFLAVVVIAAVAVVVQANSKPQKVKYSVSKDAIKINDRELPLTDFKSYSLTSLNNKPTAINFIPKKRFKGQATLQVPEKDFDVKKLQIFLAAKLPETSAPNGLLDFISQKIRG